MTQKLAHRKIGRVVSQFGPSFSLVEVRMDPGMAVRPGQLVYAEVASSSDTDKVVILRVNNATEHNEYENPLSSKVRDTFGIDSSRGRLDLLRQYVVASTQPIEAVSLTEGGVLVSEDPDIIVPAGTEVYENIPGLNGKVLGFLDPDDAGAIRLGEGVGGDGVKVVLDANAVLPRHILIAGSTGTGKSYLLGKITEEVERLGISHVNIDVHGELNAATQELGGETLVPGDDITVKLSSLAEPEVLNMLPLNNQLHIDIVTRAFSNLKKTGRDFSAETLRGQALAVAESYGSGKSTLGILEARIDTLNGVSILGSGYDWGKALSKPGALINLDCRDLGHTELRIVVGAVARELMKLRGQRKIGPLVLSMDEAHLFLPGGDSSPSSQVLSELIRFGRHHGVGIIIASQSPSDIDKKIVKITNTRFFFAMEPSELASVSGLLADAPQELIQNLSRLRVGTCLLVGSRETVKHSLVMRVAKRATKHGGETPRMIQGPGGISDDAARTGLDPKKGP